MAKKTIMLVCSAGMSTSLLVTKMQKAAEDRGMEADIFAVSKPKEPSKHQYDFDAATTMAFIGLPQNYTNESYQLLMKQKWN